MCYYEGRGRLTYVCATMRAGGAFDVCATMRAGEHLTYVHLYVLLLNLLLVCHTVVHFEFVRSTLPLPTNTEFMLQ